MEESAAIWQSLLQPCMFSASFRRIKQVVVAIRCMAAALVTASVYCSAAPDLQLRVMVSHNPISVGELLTYELSVTNQGTENASDVVLVSEAQTNATYFSASTSQGLILPGTSSVTNNIGNLAPGAGARLSFVTTPTAIGTLTNDALVICAEVDADTSNNSDSISTLVVPLTLYPGPNMIQTRYRHTATKLLDGRVLIAGGQGSGPASTTAELYDPQSKSFLSTGNLPQPMYLHRATLLLDGTVLLTGGLNNSRAAMLYTTNGTFLTVSNMINYHGAGHSATLLQDGSVLVCGGDNMASAERYLPAIRGFVPAGTRSTGSAGHQAVLLTNGTVALLDGAWINNLASTNDIFVPSAGTFVPIGLADQPLGGAAGTELLDGNYFMAGGFVLSSLQRIAKIFHPTTTNFTFTAPMIYFHPHPTVTRLGDGKVLVLGTDHAYVIAPAAQGTPELFDPIKNEFSRTAVLAKTRQEHTATLLDDGTVLITGGAYLSYFSGWEFLRSTEVYDPNRTRQPPAIAIGGTSILEGDGAITNLSFPVNLSSPVGLPVSVTYNFNGESTGTATFPPGVTNIFISISRTGDRDYEPDQAFPIFLGSPVNAVLSVDQAVGMFIDDDPFPTVTISPAAVIEPDTGITNLTLNAYLSATSYQPILVNWFTTNGSAIAGLDYLATNGVLTFDPGITNTTFTVPVKGDPLIESHELFYIGLTPATNTLAGPQASVTIVNNDGLPGMLDHFSLSPVPSPQYATFPFGLTITARDISNNIVNSFTNGVSITGNSTNAPGYWFDFEEADFSQWTPTYSGNTPGPYEIAMFDVAGRGQASLAFRVAANAGAPDGITRTASLPAGAVYNFSADLAAFNADAGFANIDPGKARLFVNNQEIAFIDIGVFGIINPLQTFRTNISANFFATSNGLYELSVRFDRGAGQASVWNYVDNVRMAAPALAPSWLSPFTNGIWTGNLVAATTATNLSLRVADGVGHLGQGAVFSVLNYADLAVLSSFAPNPARVGSNLVCTFTVTNRGPSALSSVVFTNGLPPNTTFISATSTVGTCSFTNGSITAGLGLLTNGQREVVTVVHRPNQVSTITNRTGVFSPDFDPQLTNNRATNLISVLPPLLYLTGQTIVERAGASTNVVFNLVVGTPFVQNITVNYATANGTALAGQDYVATSGQLTFTPAITNRMVSVTVLSDLVQEPSESFALNLSNPINVELANGGTATATILNTDPAPGLDHFQFSSVASPQQGNVAFPISITARSTNEVWLTNYSSYLILSATNALGISMPVIPDSIPMANGVWTGSVTFPTWDYQGVRLKATSSDGQIGQSASFEVVPPAFSLINLAASDLVYSEKSGVIYASTPTTSTLTPINPFTATVGVPYTISNLSGRLCASDGGQYIFAALNGTTNRICQFDVVAQSVTRAWGSVAVSDMSPIIGATGAVAVAAGGALTIYDQGIARSNWFNGAPGLIESSRSPGRLYGYYGGSPGYIGVMSVDASGVKTERVWGAPVDLGDIFCRGGWMFTSSGRFFEPERGVESGFLWGSVFDDADSGRYFLLYAPNLYVYDQNTRLQIGAATVPQLTSVAGSLIRWGTNGIALRVNGSQLALVRIPFLASGPSANLQLSAALPTQPLPSGQELIYSLIVSNLGPFTARNVVLTHTLPANTSFVSATSNSGSNVLSGGGVIATFADIPAGTSATLSLKLQTLKAGLLAAIASVTSDSLDPNLSNNVVNVRVSVGATLERNTVRQLVVPTTDLLWDKSRNRLVASVPNSDLLLGNNLLELEPTTGLFDPPISVGVDPTKLAVASDGSYLYVALQGEPSIQRVSTLSRAVDLKFPTIRNTIFDLEVVPDRPKSVAGTVYLSPDVVVYDDGQILPFGVEHGTAFPTPIEFGANSSRLYAAMPGVFRRIDVTTNGATILDDAGGLISGFDTEFKYDAGRVFTGGGRVFNPEAKAMIGTAPYAGLVVPDAKAGRAFYLHGSGNNYNLTAVNFTNLQLVGSFVVTNVLGTPTSLVRWGADGLAFRTTGGQLYVIRTILADDRDSDSLPDSWELQYFTSVNSPGAGPTDDPDGDGVNNLMEFQSGWNPVVVDGLRLLSCQLQQNGDCALSVFGQLGQSYWVLASTNLSEWEPIIHFTCTNQPMTVVDSVGLNFRQRYYRIAPSPP